MKTYKYNVDIISKTYENTLPDFLNNMGKDGWRVVNVILDDRKIQWVVIFEKEEES